MPASVPTFQSASFGVLGDVVFGVLNLLAQVVLENLVLCVLGGAAAVWLAARGLTATNGFMRSPLGPDLPFCRRTRRSDREPWADLRVMLRRHEIGLRRALGASDGRVLRLFVGQGARQLALGLIASAVLSVVALAAVGQIFSLDGTTVALLGVVVLTVVSCTVLSSIYLSVRGVLELEPSAVLRFA
jgi:hypothetical protein